LITARDLLRTRLQARLVTLNACSTGLQSQRNAGDELEGFNRALLLSGTSSVMLTLWNVDQDSSRQFLMTFYRNWLSGVRPMEKWRALQLAQREFLAAEGSFLQHPYHWAPFTLAGERR
jgi:CHAT domain-containing protein